MRVIKVSPRVRPFRDFSILELNSELAICNNQAGINTGSEWFKKSLATLALQLKAKKSAAQFDFWWATDDKHISQGRRGGL